MYPATAASATVAGKRDFLHASEATSPTATIPESHKSMMNVVPMPKRPGDNGIRIIVP